MFRRLLFTALTAATGFSVNAQISSVTSFSVSDEGDMISWQTSRGSNELRVYALPVADLSGAPNFRLVSGTPPATAICSNDSKTITWSSPNGVYTSEIKSDSIVYSKNLTALNKRDIFWGINSDQSRVLIKSRPEGKGEKGCDPIYSALVVGKKYRDSVSFTGPLTSTKECSGIVSAGFTRSGFICFNAYREYGINLLRELPNGTFQKDELPAPENTEKGTGYWTSGSDRIYAVFRMNGTDADSVFGIYCYEFSDGKYLAPVLIASEKTKWRPQISISPDGNTVVWTKHPYFERLSNTENRQLKISHFENNQWQEPLVLLDFGEFKIDTEIQYSTIRLTNKNIFLQNYNGTIFYYYSSLDQNGVFTKLNLTEIVKAKPLYAAGSYDITVNDTIAEGEYYPVSFFVKNTGKDSLRFDIYNVETTPFSVSRNGKIDRGRTAVAAVWGAGEIDPLNRTRPQNSVSYAIAPNDSARVRIWISTTTCNSRQVFMLQQTGGSGQIRQALIVKTGFVLLRKARGFYMPSCYSNGQMLECFYREESDRVVYRSWYKNGKTKSVFTFDLLYKREGFSAIYDENGNPITVREQKNKKQLVTRYYANQKLQEKYQMRSGCMIGKWQRWNADGQLLSEAKFRRFKIVTIMFPSVSFHSASAAKYYREYYANGKLKAEAHYSKTGRLRGNLKFWYENGNRWTEQKYFRDKRKGKYKVYDSNGKLCYSGDPGKTPAECPEHKMKLPVLVYGTQHLYYRPSKSPF